MARSRRGFNQVRSQKRLPSWSQGPGSDTVQTLVAEGKTILGSGIQPVVDGLTVVRTRGILELVLKTSSTAGGGISGAFGIAVCTNDAFAVGVTAVPDPVADAGWNGWAYHYFFGVHSLTATIADGVNAGAVYDRHVIDGKAMRKLADDMTYYGVIEVSEEIGSVACDVHFDSRVLFKLP